MRVPLPKTAAQEPPKETNDWSWVRLGDYSTKIGSGLTPLGGHRAYQQSGIPLIRSQNVHLTRFESAGLVFISAEQDEEMAGSRVQDRDVLLNITGASIGRVCVAPPEICPANVNQHVCIIRTDGRLDPDFLAFYLASPAVQKSIMDSQAGATRQALTKAQIEEFQVPWCEVSSQRRIAARLHEQLVAVAEARAALQAQIETLDTLVHAVLRESLTNGKAQPARFGQVLHEVTGGIGDDWSSYPVLGATREGLAPAKESVGKTPGRYKPVRPGTIFYNPMRILLGSIAMLDEDDAPGITSPDYVVMTAVEGRLSARWFYSWFRSRYGAEFIKSMTRGAVRERLMFKRLAPATLLIPDWKHQQAAESQLAAIRQAKARLVEKLAALEHLPTALLREAFAGHL
jgi:type I restriction enzyme, S subunit